ncbi:hypothetical protein [Alloyangia pacifica]|uniref:hypothetical protein n=1 Tax=Alloyangia pacifica TaxID=311180 RepID=UPI001CD2C0A2|nr:hypothetical protein [Alloyangia pacifica]MCA0996314.1 hypothetical protein [Alloyangia pacifica]
MNPKKLSNALPGDFIGASVLLREEIGEIKSLIANLPPHELALLAMSDATVKPTAISYLRDLVTYASHSPSPEIIARAGVMLDYEVFLRLNILRDVAGVADEDDIAALRHQFCAAVEAYHDLPESEEAHCNLLNICAVYPYDDREPIAEDCDALVGRVLGMNDRVSGWSYGIAAAAILQVLGRTAEGLKDAA